MFLPHSIGPGSFSLDHLDVGPGSFSLDHLDVSFEWDALDLFVDWPSAVFEHFLCTNAVNAASPHTDAARTAVPRPGATTNSPNATAAPSANFFKRESAGSSADASGSTETSPTIEANDSQLRGTVIALVNRSAHKSAPGMCSACHNFICSRSLKTWLRSRRCLVRQGPLGACSSCKPDKLSPRNT